MRNWIVAAAAALLLNGCSMLPYGPQVKAIADQAAITAVADRQAFNDKKLTVSLAAVCDNSLGAVLRLQDDQMRDSLFAICGSDGQSVTIARLADLIRTLDQLKAAAPR
ncbi:MAG TPA: hypothetical protein VFG64_07300 [Dongiaceae bacterium]|nr:hypothetical protein [Dongiaceae bacterium]